MRWHADGGLVCLSGIGRRYLANRNRNLVAAQTVVIRSIFRVPSTGKLAASQRPRVVWAPFCPALLRASSPRTQNTQIPRHDTNGTRHIDARARTGTSALHSKKSTVDKHTFCVSQAEGSARVNEIFIGCRLFRSRKYRPAHNFTLCVSVRPRQPRL